MLRDWDYVLMDDYRRDMAEFMENAAATLSEMKEQIDGLKRLVWCLVESAGGKSLVGRSAITNFDAKRAEFTVYDDSRVMGYVVTTSNRGNLNA